MSAFQIIGRVPYEILTTLQKHLLFPTHQFFLNSLSVQLQHGHTALTHSSKLERRSCLAVF